MDTIEMQITMTADISITDEDLKDNLEMTVKQFWYNIERINYSKDTWRYRPSSYRMIVS